MNKSLSALILFACSSAGVTAAETATPVETTPPAVVKLAVGLDYSTGDYGFTQDTEVWSSPTSLSYEKGRWALKGTVPFLSITGPATIVSGTGPAAGAPPRPTTKTERGLGDAMLAATYHARPVPGELNIDLNGRVKFPTADEDRGLGTGEMDYYTQVDLYQNFGAITPFATVGYRFLGSSASFTLNDGLYATAGAAYLLSPKTVIGAAYDWRSRIIDGAEHGTDALAFISTSPTKQLSLLAYGIFGFNDASPNLGIGGLVTYKF